MANETTRYHFYNGDILPESDIHISVRDIGLLRSFGVFDFLITYQGGKPFHLCEHVERMFHSADLIGLSLPYQVAEVCEWVYTTLKANPQGEKAIRLIATGGTGPDSITPNYLHPTFLILVDPLSPYPKAVYEEGVLVTLQKFSRSLPASKSLNYLQSVPWINEAKKLGGVEVVYHNGEFLLEGATSNIFLVIDNVLCTPAFGILKGVTRNVVMKLFPGEVEERVVCVDELAKASEVFITASNKEIMPVVRIGSTRVGNGLVGEVTTRVMTEFRRYTSEGRW